MSKGRRFLKRFENVWRSLVLGMFEYARGFERGDGVSLVSVFESEWLGLKVVCFFG